MPRLKDIKEGCASLDDFYYWINERHSIWEKRNVGQEAPWTDDEILKKYKFTNAFRELDRGTIALHNMIQRWTLEDGPAGSYKFLLADDLDVDALAHLVWTIWWYRLFNFDAHANHFTALGTWPRNPDDLYAYLRPLHRKKQKIFTSAHMTTGREFEDKIDTYWGAVVDAWDNKDRILDMCRTSLSMKSTHKALMECSLVGGFNAYEIVCDFRNTPLLADAKDIFSWANMGPGAQRGLRRLNLPHKNQGEGLESMRQLYAEAADHLGKHVRSHVPMVWKIDNDGEETCKGFYYRDAELDPLVSLIFSTAPPFELREIEHSLCEFDKYMRVVLGEGTPRQKYRKGGCP